VINNISKGCRIPPFDRSADGGINPASFCSSWESCSALGHLDLVHPHALTVCIICPPYAIGSYLKVKTSGGKVEIPLYRLSKGDKFEAYDGNGRLDPNYTYLYYFVVTIVDKGSEIGYGTTMLASKKYDSVTFNNGNLTVQWE